MTEAQGYAATIIGFSVHPVGQHPYLGREATNVRLVDEGGGCYIELEQNDQSVQIDFAEVEMIVQAISKLRAQKGVEPFLDPPVAQRAEPFPG
jgi:hypothetical protein